ncbi:hypothetical protein RclHR1_00080018 [Rhizophagus clarus]|uniref:Uncharacterized protein n=1 Tax=Rhizophagus clarus TaxID=94130 RepID=A0A2Z6S185_9GLOM|nr:hypothetical protein RclHR1_00080018 [Rhizophagus clarus]
MFATRFFCLQEVLTFGVYFWGIDRVNDQLEPPPSADMSLYDDNINLAVDYLKLILRTSGSINECENEAERFEFVATILRGVVSTFDENYNIKLRREFTLSGTYGKGRTDFAITYNKKIFCAIEVKVVDLEYGFCENLVQVQSECYINLHFFMCIMNCEFKNCEIPQIVQL